MKLRVLWVVALLVSVAGGAHAADSGKKNSAPDTGIRKLTIPSMDVGGGSLAVSTDNPSDPDVPTFNDPRKQDKPVEPFFGLKFTRPLDGN